MNYKYVCLLLFFHLLPLWPWVFSLPFQAAFQRLSFPSASGGSAQSPLTQAHPRFQIAWPRPTSEAQTPKSRCLLHPSRSVCRMERVKRQRRRPPRCCCLCCCSRLKKLGIEEREGCRKRKGKLYYTSYCSSNSKSTEVGRGKRNGLVSLSFSEIGL